MRVLIAEDNKAVSLIISKIVEQTGHDYCIAADGEHAMTMLAQREIDLVLLDVEMPKLDGYAVAKHIRKTYPNKWIPIVFISGHTDNKSLNKGLIAGADDYIFKPVNSLLLKAKLTLFERLNNNQAH